MTSIEAATTANQLIRLPAVLEMVGYGRSTVLDRVKKGQFPAPIALGPRAVAWVKADVEGWIEQRIAASRVGSH